ncbi:MAG: DUF2845 domain-containing protein [Deltaproteobacteria bacterium]|nr:DUF2845 domain-containing protein [Deltaproteobacteria bacterium]
MALRSLGSALLLGATLACASFADTLRCDRGLVSEGDAKVQVLKACGEPTYQEPYQEERVSGARKGRSGAWVERRSTVNVDEWTYNFGPGQFLYTLTFRNGRVTSIAHNGYGYPPTTVEEGFRYWDGRDCKEGGFRIDDRSFDVLMKCGQPLLREAREEERAIRVFDGDSRSYREHRVTFLLDEWTYNFGSRRLIYVLRFTDGVLTEIETGGYGY